MEAGDTQIVRLKVFKGALVIAAMLPFLFSLGFHLTGPSEQQPAEGIRRPALAFDQYLVDLRQVPPRDIHFARFAFTNTGSDTVTITDLEPSCGCLKPHLEKRVYQPNESGEFFVRVTTPNEEPGQKEYIVKMAYEDPQPRQVDLTFKMILPERQVTVRPRALLFYQLGTQTTSKEIVITDFREKPLEITGIEHASDLITTQLGEVDEDEFGHRRLRVLITVAAQVPPGKNRDLLIIRTNDPEFAKLQVPLIIQGPKSPRPSVSGKPSKVQAPRF